MGFLSNKIWVRMFLGHPVEHPYNPETPYEKKLQMEKIHKTNLGRICEKNKRKSKAWSKTSTEKKQGQGFLPSDPNALCEWMELLTASKQAGNTGLRNEIVSICDELLRQNILSRDAYKNLMLALNKW